MNNLIIKCTLKILNDCLLIVIEKRVQFSRNINNCTQKNVIFQVLMFVFLKQTWLM